jgi:HK97 family phage major capsid protein
MSDISALRAERAELQRKAEAITARCTSESRALRADEAAELHHLETKQAGLLDREMQMDRDDRSRQQFVRDVRSMQLPPESPQVGVTGEPLTYQKHGQHSYFRDLFQAQRFNDPEARARLTRHTDEMRVEQRDLSSTDGVGGEFISPLWMASEWIPAVRAGRPFANVVRSLPLPPNTDSINVPKVLTGTATAAHADLGAVQETDPATGSISVAVKTIAGQVDISRQALERSTPGLDQVLFDDLVADYSMRLDLGIISGSGSGANLKGVLSDSNRITVTWTQASPTVALFFNKVADAIQQISTQRPRAPTHLILHPRRWAWITAASDTTGRPLIVPGGGDGNQNQPGTTSALAAEGVVGTLQGLQVVLDANITTTAGAGTNQDVAIVTRAEDNFLFELPRPVTRLFEDVLSGNLAVRLQAYGYAAFTSERLPKANASIEGNRHGRADVPELRRRFVDPFETFDMLNAEAALFDVAMEKYVLAGTQTAQLDALNRALGFAFGALEHVAVLRVHDLDQAQELAETWREVVLDIARRERGIIESATAPTPGGRA